MHEVIGHLRIADVQAIAVGEEQAIKDALQVAAGIEKGGRFGDVRVKGVGLFEARFEGVDL